MKQGYNGNSSITFNTKELPSDWDVGFRGHNQYRPACGGHETPVYYGDCGWTLLCWDKSKMKRCLYIYSSDTFHYDIQNYI